MADTTETLYTVARDKEILTGLRSQVRAAKSDLAGIESNMRAAGLEPDVHLATVTRTTRVSAPKRYVEETVAIDEPAEQGDAEPESDAR